MEEKKEVQAKKVAPECHGKVKDCEALRLRKEASLDSEVLALIPAGQEFVILKKGSTDDFWKVSYGKLTGYCMKSFVDDFLVKEKQGA